MRTESRTESITAATIKKTNLPDGARELTIRDTSLKGFALRIFRGGARYVFTGRIKGTGMRRTITIGDAWAMPAKDARTGAEALRSQFLNGLDPVAIAAQEQAARVTLGDLAQAYVVRFEDGKLPHQRRAPTAGSILSENVDVARAVRLVGPDTLIDEIGTATLNKLIDDLGTYAPGTRKKTFGCIGRILNRAVASGAIELNPALHVARPVGGEPRERFLSESELAKVWDAAGKMGPYGRVVQFLIVMPVRASIARDLRFDDIDYDAATLHVSAVQRGNKSRTAWVLPLPDLALECVGEVLPQPFVFRGAKGGQVALSTGAKARLDEASGVTGWTLHDLRRTCVSLLAEALNEIDVDAADQWLMHKRTGVKGIYQRGHRLKAMRRVADQWNGVLSRITGAEQPTVVRLHR